MHHRRSSTQHNQIQVLVCLIHTTTKISPVRVLHRHQCQPNNSHRLGSGINRTPQMTSEYYSIFSFRVALLNATSTSFGLGNAAPGSDMFAPSRSQSDLQFDETHNFPRQPVNGLSSSPGRRHAERALDSAIAGSAPRKGPQQAPSSAQYKMIGNVYANGELNHFRFLCHVDGCINNKCSSTQELRQHWDAFHHNSVRWCPCVGCSRSEGVGTHPYAREEKEKLKEHVRKLHNFELELRD